MDDFIRKFLKHRGFSNDVIKAVEEKTKKISEEDEMVHRLKAEALAKVLINEAMPSFREYMKKMEEAKKQPKPERKIIIDEK